ncbi:hypothetical protein L596_020007 [Steinernema carpocapsae]|uniref:Uncharacterized protein n=1 Tax=Steinernema carpocapsae TaxID=34508 RepID=A0A4U5MSE0_STECR|nr:hypothetical protein L596_020007 [Steinernema carpocapsae]
MRPVLPFVTKACRSLIDFFKRRSGVLVRVGQVLSTTLTAFMSFCDLSSNYTVARGRTYDLYKTQFFDFNRRSVPQRRRNPREDAGSIEGASPASEGTPKESAKSSVARGVSLASEGSPSAGTGAEKPKRKIHKAADKPAYRYAKVPLCMAQKFYGSRIPCKAQQLFGIPRKNMKPSKGYEKVFGERTTKDGKAAFFVRFLHVLQEKMTERKLNAVLEDEYLKDETVLEWLSASSPDTVTCKNIVRLGIRMQRQLTEEVSSSLYAVENFLEKVVVPKDRLIEENAELRMKLAEARAEIACSDRTNTNARKARELLEKS